jgi:hypothetical protein
MPKRLRGDPGAQRQTIPLGQTPSASVTGWARGCGTVLTHGHGAHCWAGTRGQGAFAGSLNSAPQRSDDAAMKLARRLLCVEEQASCHCSAAIATPASTAHPGGKRMLAAISPDRAAVEEDTPSQTPIITALYDLIAALGAAVHPGKRGWSPLLWRTCATLDVCASWLCHTPMGSSTLKGVLQGPLSAWGTPQHLAR